MTRTVDCTLALTPDGWRRNLRLHIDEDGAIFGIGGQDDGECDARLAGPVIPGMPNLHSHAFQRLMAGLSYQRGGNGDSFWTWRDTMYGMAARVSPEQLAQCAAGLYAEMLVGGYTACAEFHYLHHDIDGRPYDDPTELSGRILDAAERTGIGLTLLPVLYSRAGFDADDVGPRQIRFRHTVDGYLTLIDALRSRLDGFARVRLGIAPHSLRAVDEAALREVVAATPDGPVHIHIAEQPLEVEDCVAALGQRPVAWLLDHVDVNERWCLVHATHMDDEECAAAAATRAVAGLCPTTEADLGDGVFDASRWMSADGAFGVGSDSNLRIDAAEELRQLEFSQRLVTQRRNVLADAERSCGRWLYERAALGGARALGQPVGRISKGFRADLVELDGSHPRLAGLEGDALLDSYVFAGGPDMIRSVHVGGELKVEHGSHVNRASIEPAFGRVLKALRSVA